MVYLATTEEWQRQSSLLLQARPTTTRITTKYNIPNLDSPKYQKRLKRKLNAEGGNEQKDGSAHAQIPRAVLTLKTYDPESGVVLKLKTDRAAEVGRLINGLGRLGRHMAALPQKTEDSVMEDAPSTHPTTVSDHAPATSATAGPADGKIPQPSAGVAGGPKKKKKGKK